MIFHVENPKDSITKFLEITCDYSKVAEYKVNIEKLTDVLHTSNEQQNFEIKNKAVYTGNKKWNNSISLIKCIQDLYEENDRILMKEIKEDLNKWRATSCILICCSFASCVQLFVTPRTTAHQAFMSHTIFWSLLKVMAIESVMPSNYLILCRPLLPLPSIFPSIRVFSNESVLRIRLSRVFSNTTVQKLQFFCTQVSL